MTGSSFIFSVICLSILFPLKIQAQSLKLVRISSNTSHVDLGKTLILNATYTYTGTGDVGVIWKIGTKILVEQVRGGSLDIDDSRASLERRATLVLKNTTLSDSGTYTMRASIRGYTAPDETFTVIIQVKSIAKVNCTTPVNLREGENLSCICYGVNGSPPPTAYWLKDNNPIPITKGYLSALLDKRNVCKNDKGTYTCRVQSGTLIDEQRLNVTVLHGPTVINFKSNIRNNTAQIGDNIKLTCLVDGNPKPSYTIAFVKNQTFEEVLTSCEGILIIDNVNIGDNGLYRCVATNIFNSKEAKLVLNVMAKTTQTTTTAPTTTPNSSTNTTTASSSMTNLVPRTATEKSISDKNCGGTEWYIVVITLFCGIGIGIIFSFTVMWMYRQKREKRDSQPSEARGDTETHDNPSVYQELDLQRMNKEDNYQSLRKTSRHVGHQEPTAEVESGYQELDKVRGNNDDNNYQSLNRI